MLNSYPRQGIWGRTVVPHSKAENKKNKTKQTKNNKKITDLVLIRQKWSQLSWKHKRTLVEEVQEWLRMPPHSPECSPTDPSLAALASCYATAHLKTALKLAPVHHWGVSVFFQPLPFWDTFPQYILSLWYFKRKPL